MTGAKSQKKGEQMKTITNWILPLIFFGGTALAGEFEVVGGCFVTGGQGLAAAELPAPEASAQAFLAGQVEDPFLHQSDYLKAGNETMALAYNGDLQQLALTQRQCTDLKTLNQGLTYVGITLGGINILTGALTGTSLTSMVMAAGVANPVVVTVSILGGGVAYLVLRVSLDECAEMSEKVRRENVQRALTSTGLFQPINSNVPIIIGG
jgi:hypothetical protein